MALFTYEEVQERLQRGEAVQSIVTGAVYTLKKRTLYADGVAVPPTYIQLDEQFGLWTTAKPVTPADTLSLLLHPSVFHQLAKLSQLSTNQ